MIRKSVIALQPYTPGEQPKLKKLIKLNTNENAYPPSPKVDIALRNLNVDNLRRYPDPMCVAIRECLAKIHNCSIDNIFVGNGSDEVLSLATDAFVENDGLIGFFSPSYSLYPVLTEIRDAKKKELPLPQVGSLKQASNEAAACDLFFIANPNAPTSCIFSHEEIIEFSKSLTHGILIVDEAYADFAEQPSCAELFKSNPNILISRTLSKSYSLAGARLGYLIGEASLIEAMYKIKDSYNINMLTQAVALAAIQDQEWMKSNCQKIIATRNRITSELRALGWFVEDSHTNFIWTKPPSHITATEAKDKLRAEGIIIRHFSSDETKDYIRITVGTDEEMNALMDVIKTF